MWKKTKAALFNWFFLLLFIFMLIAIILVMAVNLSKLLEEKEERIVEETFTSKGLYFGLQYYVHLSDGKEHRISKKDFLSLEKGDIFHVFSHQSSFKDFLLFTAILGLFLCASLAMAYLFAGHIFGQMRWFTWIDEKKEAILSSFKGNKKAFDIFKRVLMIALILSLALMLLFIVKNAVYKIVPYGKTNTVAKIMDHEKDRTISPKAVIFTYTFTYQYKDEDGKWYKTRKNVSSATYNRYKEKGFVPIRYRNNHPYDTFIDNRSIGEFVRPLLNIPTFMFAIIGYFVYFLIRKYVEVWGIPFIRIK